SSRARHPETSTLLAPAVLSGQYLSLLSRLVSFFLFSDRASTEIYTLSLHDALPIYTEGGDEILVRDRCPGNGRAPASDGDADHIDRKSTRLNSSHRTISYAVFCLKKKTKNELI